MGFRAYPFVEKKGTHKDPKRFPGHKEVLEHLKDFLVRSRKRGENDDQENLDEVFDAVVVCNGHYTKPRPVEIPENVHGDGSVAFREGNVACADAILHCTGYCRHISLLLLVLPFTFIFPFHFHHQGWSFNFRPGIRIVLCPQFECDDWLAAQGGCLATEERSKKMYIVSSMRKKARPETYRDQWEDEHLISQSREDFLKYLSEVPQK
ncbi:hypothetical protein ACH5RR_040186 [Cinchona calisaya]|uniref:Flavin-containing monooxygenase n=1 Tax=Cinchona calisaya TaxID=153742 RepID=A0ABD2XTH7_9GENT